MKFILQLILTILASWVCQSFFPWWSAVVASSFLGFIFYKNRGFYSFLAGFLAVFLLWIGYALIIDINSQSILTGKVANILTVNNKYILILITGVIGGLPAGFGALSGNQIKKIFKKEKSDRYYS